MKKTFIFFASVMAIAILTSCGTAVQPTAFKVNPSPLTVVGDLVEAEITGTFPVKQFGKKAVLTVTPVLKYEGGQVAGKAVTYVGEKAKENGSVVSYKEGGKFKLNVSFAYVPAMAKSELYLQFTAKNGNKEVIIPETKVADGVLSTAKIAVAEDIKPQVTADKFQRIIQEIQEADIKFLIQQTNLRNSELKSQEMKDLHAAIKTADTTANKAINSLKVAGYASPDGKEDLNAKLADVRQDKAQKYLQKQLKKAKVNATIDSEVTAEDWAGFQEALENSNINEKEMVLRVLSMYTDPEEREAQIKNLSETFKTIKDEILPQLRRSRLILTTDLIGKSDEEIAALAKNDPAALNVEELLYAATLTNDLSEKAEIYKTAVAQYAGDYRSHNNLGKVAEARRCYAKALQIAPNNADVHYNAGVAAMAENDLAKAEEHLGKAAGTEGDLNAAMGTLYTMKGDYAAAKNAYGNTASNNAAVQHILNEDYAAARTALANVENPNGTTAYLLAVVNARQNNRDAVYENLKVATQRDASLKAKAQNDIEFAKYQAEEAFKAIVK